MVTSAKKLDTIEDLINSGERRAELVDGVIRMMAPASVKHSNVQITLAAPIRANCDAKRGNGDDDSWLIIPEAWTYYNDRYTFVHDIAGFSRQELPSFPSKGPIDVRPKWVCEIISPSNWSHDTQTKRVILEQYRVPFYWLVDPIQKTILVFEMIDDSEHYQIIQSASVEDGIVRLRPFADLDLDLVNVFE